MIQRPLCLQKLHLLLSSNTRTIIDLPKGFQRASVLVPFFLRDEEWKLIFIRRTEIVTNHKNEISFPGGRYEPDKDKDLVETALREAFEEIGVKTIDILGLIDDIFTISKYVVTPVVGFIQVNEELDRKCFDLVETNYVIEAPLNHLTNTKYFSFQGVTYKEGIKFHVPFFSFQEEIIWGATGRILINLFNLLKGLDTECKINLMKHDYWILRETDSKSLYSKYPLELE